MDQFSGGGSVSDVLHYTKQHRYPKAPHWNRASSRYGEGIPSFFCGGGALSEFYSSLLHAFEERQPPFRLRTALPPVPDDFEASGLGPDTYARFAVAYGLSFDPWDIGQIVRMNEIEDVHADDRPGSYRDRYVGQELT